MYKIRRSDAALQLLRDGVKDSEMSATTRDRKMSVVSLVDKITGIVNILVV